jgi:hypothetical protein
MSGTGTNRALGPDPEWQTSLECPVRRRLFRDRHAPSLDDVRGLYAPPQGEPAFDPEIIEVNIGRLHTTPVINTGNAHLDLVVKTGLAYIDATFRGDHPKYGVRHYAEERHDAFPPTIVAAVDALSAWGLHADAARLFRYWLLTFVNEDGTIRYYGPSLSDYGQILHTAALLRERAGLSGWWDEGCGALARMADRLMALCAKAEKNDDLIPGVPEADVSSGEPLHVDTPAHSERNRYFHNNAWVARGLQRWADLAQSAGFGASGRAIADIKETASRLADRTVAAIRRAWPADPHDWWLTPQVEPCPRPQSLTSDALGSYTNYRYWPELLSSAILPAELGNRIVEARLSGGGQFCGMTRFQQHLDDWPLVDYLFGLWRLGRKDDFLFTLYGHVAYHHAAGHLTAYEQVSFPPGREVAPYCLPCQLVATRAARLLC